MPDFIAQIFDMAYIGGQVRDHWLLGVGIVGIIVFVETGIVILPFLPGDSLLFATGAALGVSGVSPITPIVIVTLAAMLGDGFNFFLGRSAVGPFIIRRGWIRRSFLDKTRQFFARHGAKTITIGRFVPIVRTVAPFLAGMGDMPTRIFALYNAIGAIAWCSILILSGYWLGGVPWVADHMSWLTVIIIVVSLLPVAVELVRGRK